MKKKLLLALCALLAAASLFAQKAGLPDVLLGNWKVVLESQEEKKDEEYIEKIDVRISEFSIFADTYSPRATVKLIKGGGWKIIDVKTDVSGKKYTAITLTEQGEGDPTPAGYYGKMTIWLNEFPQECKDEYGDDLKYYINKTEGEGKPYFVLLFWSVKNQRAEGLSQPPDFSSQHDGSGFWYAHFDDLEATSLKNAVGKVPAGKEYEFKPQPATMYVLVKGNE
jgi:hypothetical protein